MQAESIHQKVQSFLRKYQDRVQNGFREHAAYLNFVAHPNFGYDLLITKSGDYAKVIFQTKAESGRTVDTYSDPEILDINFSMHSSNYHKTGDLIGSLTITDKTIATVDSDQTVEHFIDIKLQELEKRSLQQESHSLHYLLSKYGLTDCNSYLKAAADSLAKNNPQGFSDCKNNCRKAWDSALEGLTGSKNLDQIALQLGDKETELFRKLQSFNAKHGSHTPTPTKFAAELSLNLTRAALKYLLETGRTVN